MGVFKTKGAFGCENGFRHADPVNRNRPRLPNISDYKRRAIYRDTFLALRQEQLLRSQNPRGLPL